MTGAISRYRSFCIAWALLIVVVTGVDPAFAAGQENGWRPTYDLVMRWLNFIILAFLIVKFSRKPLALFLKSKKEEIARNIRRVEDELEQAKTRNEEARLRLDAGKARLQQLQERIVNQGEKEKKRLVEEARQESRIMLEGAREKIKGQMLMAKSTIKNEIVDAAVDLAIKRLPGEISPQDHKAFLHAYLEKATPRQR